MISRKEKWAYRRARLRKLRRKKFMALLLGGTDHVVILHERIILPEKILNSGMVETMEQPIKPEELARAKLFGTPVEVY